MGTVAGGSLRPRGALGDFDFLDEDVGDFFEVAGGGIGRLGDEIDSAEREGF